MTTNENGIAKVGVFVDVSNVYSNGGQKMRFDVLRQYAQARGLIQRLNAYVSFDAERARTDREYGDRAAGFQDVLRDLGFHTTVQEVKWYFDPDSERRYGKANTDMNMAVDLILQARNLDLAILVTGDGDFVKPMEAVRDTGCRVEVIAFDNASQALRRDADAFINGYMIPELIPANRRDTPWGSVGSTVRGVCYYHQPDESFGFFAFLDKISPLTWLTDPRNPDSPYKGVFFHDSALPSEVNPRGLPSRRLIFEFEIGQSDRGMVAENVRLLIGRTEQTLPKPVAEPTWKSKLVD
ncbi:MAG TPA: NYN domain-containing protein [Anaerolineales bacterium]